MKKSHNIVAVVGTYKDANGQEKKRYTTIGAAFTREDGSMALKLESIPVGNEWNGWANLYLPKEQGKTDAPAAPAAPPASRTGGNDEPFKDDTLDGIGDGKVPFGD